MWRGGSSMLMPATLVWRSSKRLTVQKASADLRRLRTSIKN